MSSMIERTEETGIAQRGAGAEMGVSRVAAEVQAAMVIARKFPRDEVKARARIATACSRNLLAGDAVYEFPRGGQKITGASIRLLEVIAQNWGNLDFGWVEVERRPGSSTVMAYSWDLETNTRSTKVFDVPHKRDTRTGSYALTDDRDIYERVANDAARRVRSCLEAVIPGDVIEEATTKCHQTLIGKSEVPLADRALKMVEQFKAFGVTLAMIEAKLAHPVGSVTPHELSRLGRVFNSIRDGVGGVEDHFDVTAGAGGDATSGGGKAPTTATAKTLDEYAAAAKSQTSAKSGGKSAESDKPNNESPSADASTPKAEESPPGLYDEFVRKLSACVTVADVEALPIPTKLSRDERRNLVNLIDAKVKAINAAGGAK